MKVTIISGKQNSAKTTTLKKIVSQKDCLYLGYICESSSNKNIFYLRNVMSNEIIRLLQTHLCEYNQKIGKFYIVPNSFESAKKSLLSQVEENCNKDIVIVLDEVGALELSSSGYHDLIENLIQIDKDLIICVRDKYVEDVCKKYKFEDFEIIRV
jgi:nucleoside-triphosphatase THEP1